MLCLRASWTKGGKAHDIPIASEAQRQLPEEDKAFAGSGRLIPAERTYKQQLECFKAQTSKASIDRVHGLRHQYAKAHHLELTGWKSPTAGWRASKQLTPEQRHSTAV